MWPFKAKEPDAQPTPAPIKHTPFFCSGCGCTESRGLKFSDAVVCNRCGAMYLTLWNATYAGERSAGQY